MRDESLWYKNAIFYQLHVKCFCDSNDDGIGDFNGLKSKLEYIQNLGCTAIWLQPFYPSPLKDDGYDIANYAAIHPDYGTLSDFKGFLKEAHRRNLKVVTELVINHTSDQHAWFQRARRSPPNSVFHNYYMWSDTPDKYSEARIIFKDFESSNWAWDPVAKRYYWHRFYTHQPDLNYDNPQVHKEIFKVVDFWMGMGIDGMRLDAVPYLFARKGTDCENLPETHVFLKKLRHYVDANFPNRMLLAEANQWPEDAYQYFGEDDECHMAFHFPVMPRLFMALKMEERYPIIDIMEQTPSPPSKGQWAIFLRNHDELTLEMVTDEERDYMWRVYAKDTKARINLGIRRRLAPLLDNDRDKIELMNILLFSLPGSPVVYYGDEIGMGDNYYLGDRNGVRTPMQWSNDRNAGFSEANPQMLYLPLIIDPEYHHEYLNVQNQEQLISSLLWWMRSAISVRLQSRALGLGTLKFLRPSNPKVLVMLREHEEETVLIVANLSRYSQQIDLDLKEYHGRIPVDLFSQNRFASVTREPYKVTIGRYGYYWLKLEKAAHGAGGIVHEELPKFAITKKWDEVFSGMLSRKFLAQAVQPYLKRCRWFRSKALAITKVHVEDSVPIGEARLIFLNVHYENGLYDTYLLPLCVTGNKSILERHPQAAIAEIEWPGQVSQYLIDAVYDESFRTALLMTVVRGKRFHGVDGMAIKGTPSNGLRKIVEEENVFVSRVLAAEQTNTSIIYGNRLFLKIYRQIDEGENVELSIARYFSEKAKSNLVPPFKGELSFQKDKIKAGTVALLQEYAQNSGDLWTLTLDTIRRYFEETLSDGKCEFQDVWYLQMIEKLAKKTAEMHLTLGEATEERLRPEHFSIHYQKGLYQAMRTQLQRNLTLLRKEMPVFEEGVRENAEKVLLGAGAIIRIFDDFMEAHFSISKIMIHGDYHLGQVLHSMDDLFIIDFEGEPAVPLSQRRLKRLALQDVAGMTRSFHYAVQKVLDSYTGSVAEKLVSAGEVFTKTIQECFLNHYYHMLDRVNSSLVPKEHEKRALLLDALVLHKAVYELGYELQNRPQWINIPLLGIINSLEERHVDKIEKLVH